MIVADGVRNPWRFSFDRANGDLWIGDVGQGSIEEVDHVAWPWKGLLNFGWDVYEGRASFEQKTLGPGKLVMPVAQYSHARGCSITGGYVYRGSAVPAAKGRYFYGDYCSGTVWSLKLVNGAARQIRPEPFTVKSLTSFGEDAAGELYAVSARARSTSSHPERRDRRAAPQAAPGEHADRDADRVDQHVVPGCMPAADEVLVELVSDGIEPAGEDRDGGTLDRPHQQGAEDRVLAQVRDLAQDQIPGAEAGRQARNRREREDHRRPENDRSPRPEASGRHDPMIGSCVTRERGEGTRCNSGTVPPL